jgi:hypothetical protein
MKLATRPITEIERTEIGSLEEVSDSFLYAQDVLPSSLATYRRNLKRFREWLEASG